ncbi:PHD and RING finger domain-containing protein-like protein [Hapsidospora chrysogenum ATCC 11550]|uniref:PHD and RING finger domain-containing protein-like protein n=1 Tax=Hapsidospora chrysogenum (strain ATCC 11550 / CBS 779.69 / DSM 880 / IAM 14645 / JCM 23072 / IMI 49137) TaxID=857340 RepID=A0A086THL3_HAPC1|nr:PHD and RING finger domain-containing protein-like protein [Hapsidospora chrysogenum ATCC 11550]
MSEPEQCIICLDSLPLPRSSSSTALAADGDIQIPGSSAANTTTVTATKSENDESANHLNVVAALDCCEHIIHDACIRSWAQKTNTCPICRNIFHTVRVFNGVDGTAISTYDVEDKKQVAEFDFQQWLGENIEEEQEQSHPCPICNSADREDILLLCDSCDAAYHTHCIGLDDIPDGDWYCMECRHMFQLADEPQTLDEQSRAARPRHISRPHPRDARGYHVRTRARLRRARRQARNAEWQGAWGQFAGRFYDLSELDLDNFDDEDEELEQFRRFQQLDRRELHRWQQRLNIAQRLGAQDAFANNIPPQITEHLQPAPPLREETRDERRAWGAFERAREAEDAPASTATRKRKARSVTASPAEPVPEPERKLKRPRTRRLPTQQGEPSGSVSSPVTAGPSSGWPNGAPAARNGVITQNDNEPALVSSLLKELEPHAHSEDENGLPLAPERRIPPGASSPVLSPSPSNHSSPRAMSMTPPPLPLNGRPTSPTLSLSSHIEPRYPPANYSPNRIGGGSGSGSDHSDSEGRSRRKEGRPLELRQPRPRRPRTVSSRVEENSPSRATMTQEEKKNINDIVKSALRPHWHAQKLTSEQYATINRDISRKLYEEVRDASSLDEDTRRSWEMRASQEVAQAVAGLSA